MKSSVSAFPQSGNYERYVVEVKLPKQFSNKVSKALASESRDMDSALGDRNLYVKLGEKETFNLLEHLNLDPFEPELPLLLLLDKHPSEVKESDEEVMIKLGAIEREKDVAIVLDEICNLMKDENFMKKLSSDERREKLIESFEEVPKVVVTLVSSVLFD